MTTERITGAEVRAGGPPINSYEDMQANSRCVPVWWLTRLAEQLDTDAAERDALRGDAEQWRALQAVVAWPTRASDTTVGRDPTTHDQWYVVLDPYERVVAPTPVELLARLDALAEVTKPKERRLWRWSNGTVVQRVEVPDQPGVYSYDLPGTLTGDNITGHPVREVVRPDGVIELHPEGT